jgi:hypothetical protein
VGDKGYCLLYPTFGVFAFRFLLVYRKDFDQIDLNVVLVSEFCLRQLF